MNRRTERGYQDFLIATFFSFFGNIQEGDKKNEAQNQGDSGNGDQAGNANHQPAFSEGHLARKNDPETDCIRATALRQSRE